jgi:predicted nucleotidyltransferase
MSSSVLGTYYPQIQAICRRHGVRRLDVFGSASDERRFDSSRSDIDLLVEFDVMAGSGPGPADRYFGLLEDLTALFGRPVDLVIERAIRNPYFRRSIDASRQSLYTASSAPS